MKVYAVWEGEFSDKEVIAVFSDSKTAHFYSMLDDRRYVEEYELDKKQMEFSQRYVFVKYYFGAYTDLESVRLYNKEIQPRISKESCVKFEFTLPLSDRNVYTWLTTTGKDSAWLLKTAQDKLAQYFYEHNTTREKQIEKHHKKIEKRSQRHINWFASTSLHTEPTPVQIANDRVTQQMHAMIINGEELPDNVKLKEMFDKALAEANEEQEEKK